MTVPVARASARRTVRVAAGLVAGQAALCAVIGYVTLGGHAVRGTEAGRIIDPLAGKPFVVSPPAVPQPAKTTAGPDQTRTVKPVPARPVAGVRPRHHPEPTPSPPAEPVPGILVDASGSTTGPTVDPATVPNSAASPDAASPTGTSGAAPSPPTSAPTQQPVTMGDPCDPAGAPGLTGDTIAMLCTLEGDGLLRWRPIG